MGPMGWIEPARSTQGTRQGRAAALLENHLFNVSGLERLAVL